MQQSIISVQFNNQSLFATLIDNVPHVAVKPICESLGIDWEAQRQKINRHPILKEGACMIKAPSNGGIQEMLMLPIRMLNGWLFGIDSSRVKAEAKEAVLKYQRECFDVLANHFMPKQSPMPRTPSGLPELLSANLTPLKKIIMLTLASHADENGQVQIGIHNLANICGIAKSTTCESVNGLEKMGFLTSFKTRYSNGGSAPNTYVIPERFRVVSGELVEPVTMQQKELPMQQEPLRDDEVKISASLYMDLIKYRQVMNYDTFKHTIEQNGGLVLMKCEVERIKDVLKA